MITAIRYAEITGDGTSAASAVSARIEEAIELLEDYLGRPVTSAVRTEAMRPDRLGRLWPKATPITAADGHEIDGYALRGPGPFGLGWDLDPASTVEVTYTGGWTSDTVPAGIARELAFAAYRLLHPAAPALSDIPANASSVRLGDAAVTFKGTAGDVTPGDTSTWWSKRTKSYRYQPVRTGPIGVLS